MDCFTGDSCVSDRRSLQAVLASKIKAITSEHKSKITSVPSLLMKLPKIATGFREAKTYFAKQAAKHETTEPQTCTVKELKDILISIGCPLTEKMFSEVIQEIDHNHTTKITFNEFVVFLTLTSILETGKAQLEGLMPGFAASVETAVDAFSFFDIDTDGILKKEEVMSRFKSESDLRDASSTRRFEEMDWNHDGTISFPEFLFAMEQWAGMDDDEDDE